MVASVYMGPLGSTQLVQGMTGGGGDLFAQLARGDFSVNSGRVENAWSDSPVLHTQTRGPLVAGGYNGGGTGSKSILGVDVGNGLPLASLVSLSWTWLDLVPYVSSPLECYCNLIVDLFGDGSLYKILVIDPASVPALNNGTTVLNLDGSRTTSIAFGTQFVLVVNDVPGYPPGVPVPAVNLNPVGSWLSRSYRVADIAAAYPAAVLRRASSLDGGLPIATVTPAMLLCAGDSGNNRVQAFKVTSIFFNGVAA
jgi:hypothetical protein